MMIIFQNLKKQPKRVKVTLKNLEKMNKVVNKNGKYSIVSEFTSKENF